SLPGALRMIRVAVANVAVAKTAEWPAPAAGEAPRGSAAASTVRGGFADVAADVRSHGLAGLELEVVADGDQACLRSPLIGEINAGTLLVALGVLIAWGVPLGEACTLLAGCTAPPGRLELVGPGTNRRGAGTEAPRVVVDYAHTPAGLSRVLDT